MPLLWSGWPFCFPLTSKRQGSPVMGSILVGQTSELIPNQRPLCHARLLLTGKSQALAVFIDSGSDVSIIDEELARQLGIQQVQLLQPANASVNKTR